MPGGEVVSVPGGEVVSVPGGEVVSVPAWSDRLVTGSAGPAKELRSSRHRNASGLGADRFAVAPSPSGRR